MPLITKPVTRAPTVSHDKELLTMNIRTRTAQAVLFASFVFWGVAIQAATPHAAHFAATLAGTSEVPPVSTTGAGTLRATLNKDHTALKWKLKFSGLTGPVTGAHFHGPAAVGVNAGVVIPLTGAITSPLSGEVTLTPHRPLTCSQKSGISTCTLQLTRMAKFEARSWRSREAGKQESKEALKQ